MRRSPWNVASMAGMAAVLLSCSSGGSSPTPAPTRAVTLSWTANREAGVNGPGGGYRIAISGMPSIDVPFVSPGPLAPTTKDVNLPAGSYSVTVSAYAALDLQGGASGSASAPSQPITVTVP